jgi:hypothetical protein
MNVKEHRHWSICLGDTGHIDSGEEQGRFVHVVVDTEQIRSYLILTATTST